MFLSKSRGKLGGYVYVNLLKRKLAEYFVRKKKNALHVLRVICLFDISLVIEKICVDFSLKKPDFSSKKWSCPNCCKIWIIMSSWIYLRVVDHMVNKESTYYWLMCHEHFEYIWLTGDTVFTDFNPTLFSKIFLVYPLISKKFKIWVYQYFELFMWKIFSDES